MEENKTYDHYTKTLNLHFKNLIEIKGLESLTQLRELYLSYNQLTEIKGLETLTQLQKLYLSHNQFTEIKGLETLTQLRELYLNENKITEIKGLETLTHLRILYLNENEITEIKGLETLTQLRELCLSNNQLAEIKGLETLTRLRTLYMYSNRITELKGLDTLIHLEKLLLSRNRITKIKGIEKLTQLQTLGLQKNQIAKIKGLKTLTELKILDLSENRIKEIKGLETLTELEILSLSGNKIIEIKGLETLTRLGILDLIKNQITEIPMSIMMCTRLEYFQCLPADVIINPIILRFLNKNKIKSNSIKMYSDTQNVHNSSINKSIIESIYKIMQETKMNNQDTILSEIVSDNVLDELTKESLIQYSNIEGVHSTLNITFKELLIVVWEIIKNHNNSDDIKKILNSEMQDSLCKCFTGRLSRLVNCLNGFDSRVQVKISDSDSIANIIVLIRNKYENDIEKQKLEVTKEMTERGYDKQMINEWLSYLE